MRLYGVLHEDGSLTDVRYYAASELADPRLVPVAGVPSAARRLAYDSQTEQAVAVAQPDYAAALRRVVLALVAGERPDQADVALVRQAGQ